jgi:hypothetical protein
MHVNGTEEQPVSARTRRHRARHRTVADLDKRSRAGRRAAQLMRQFEAELGGILTAGQQLALAAYTIDTLVSSFRKRHTIFCRSRNRC